MLQLAKLKNLSFLFQVVKPSCSMFESYNISYPILEEDRQIIEQSRKIFSACFLIYCHTDSQLLFFVLTAEAKHMTHDQIIKHTFLNKYLDRSNFTVLSTESQCEQGQLGYLKNEVADNPILECVALSPKCYSVQTIDRKTGLFSQKSAIKGCPPRLAGKIFTHESFSLRLSYIVEY